MYTVKVDNVLNGTVQEELPTSGLLCLSRKSPHERVIDKMLAGISAYYKGVYAMNVILSTLRLSEMPRSCRRPEN